MGKILCVCQQCGKEVYNFKSRAETFKFCSNSCNAKYRMMHDLAEGDVYGNWIIISKPFNKYPKTYHVRVKCNCEFGLEKELRCDYISKGRATKGCRMCTNSKRNTGCKELTGTIWAYILQSAKKRNIPVDIDINFAYDLYLSQNRKCKLSGLDIIFDSTYNVKLHHKGNKRTTASLDRIDSNGGYTKDNVQWVHKHINYMKNVFTDEYFISMCRSVTLHSEGKDDTKS